MVVPVGYTARRAIRRPPRSRPFVLTTGHRMNSRASLHQPSQGTRSAGGAAPFAWAPFLLGLVFPGLGHASIGERGRAWRIAAGFLVLWFGGLLIGGADSVTFNSPPHANADATPSRRLWFLPQAGAGPIAFITAVVGDAVRSKDGEGVIPVTMHNRQPGVIPGSTAMGHALDFGTLYCALAGMMNVAVAIDAGRRVPADRRGGRR